MGNHNRVPVFPVILSLPHALLGKEWAMDLDEPICLCFHVSKRKVVNYIRIEKPKRVGQLSECFGAGTGCGWCRPFLKRLFEQSEAEIPSSEQYAQSRASYIKKGGGIPPAGAAPIEEPPSEGE